MTDLNESATKQAIRTLVDSVIVHVQDMQYRAINHIMDPDTRAQMSQEIDELNSAVDYLKKAGMVGDRPKHIADSFIEHIRNKL